MASVTITIGENKNWFWSHDGFAALITKLIESFLPINYSSDTDQHGENLFIKFDTWKVAPYGINMETLSKKDFNMVIDSLEKGRKYLDTLLEEEQQEEFVENYIGVMAFDDLKYWVNETLKHCYSDPRYVKPVNE